MYLLGLFITMWCGTRQGLNLNLSFCKSCPMCFEKETRMWGNLNWARAKETQKSQLETQKSLTSVHSRQLGTRGKKTFFQVWKSNFPTWRSLTSWFDLKFPVVLKAPLSLPLTSQGEHWCHLHPTGNVWGFASWYPLGHAHSGDWATPTQGTEAKQEPYFCPKSVCIKILNYY